MVHLEIHYYVYDFAKLLRCYIFQGWFIFPLQFETKLYLMLQDFMFLMDFKLSHLQATLCHKARFA